MSAKITAIDYGKAEVTAYRFAAKPLEGLTPIPESSFTGRSNALFAAQVDVQVLGHNFVPAYTEGDNRNVVATDSMKNFVLKKALEFGGSTLEGYLNFLGRAFLTTYPEMESLRLTGEEVPFEAAQVPSNGSFEPSPVLFHRSHNDASAAELTFEREGKDNGEGVTVTDHSCGRVGLELIKTTGSSFTSFVRDEHTTLLEAVDRPLFIHLDVFWRYADVEDALGENASRYVAGEQVRDLMAAIFHAFNSRSIQHLVFEMGSSLLNRFPQLAEASFEAQNRLWDPAYTSEEDATVAVRTDPRPPYGHIGLTMTQDD